MKTTVYFFLASVLFSFSAFAQGHDYDGQGILYSGVNAVTIGSSSQLGGYPNSSDKGFELYSTSSTLFTMKTGTYAIQLLNSPVYGNNLYLPNNKPFTFYMGGISGPALRLQTNGNFAIGTSLNPTDFKLAVGGKIIAEELKVQLQTAWPDYVFANDYQLPTLQEVEKQIQENGHLSNIPSACDVQENGIEVGEMNRLLLEKVEELTLYTIDQQKQLDKQTKEIEELKALMNTLIQKNK